MSKVTPRIPESHMRAGVRELCAAFDDAYWRALDAEHAYPKEFVGALTRAGYLSVLIPREYGGGGLDLAAGCAVMEEVNRSGGTGGVCHARMYTMGALLRHGSAEQKRRYLPRIAAGELRLISFDEQKRSSCRTARRAVASRPSPRRPT